MIRKYKIYIIMGITVLLLFMVLPVDTKGDWEIPWDIKGMILHFEAVQ